MRTILFSITFFLITISSLSGQFVPYHFPTIVNDSFVVNPLVEYERVMGRNKYSDFSTSFISRFAADMAFGKAELFNNGNVYFKQTEIESYLVKLLCRLVPKERLPNPLKIFVTRDASCNAFVIYDGTIFVNIGLLADVDNEASLAFILAHEFAHYFFRDVQNSYAKLYNKNKNDNLTMLVNKAEYDRANELRADSFAIEVLKTNKYNLNSASSIFYKMQMNDYIGKAKEMPDDFFYKDTNLIKTEENSEIDILASHPKNEDRVNQFEKHLSSDENKFDFLELDVTSFFKMKMYAIYESLHLMLHSNQYRSCIEFAFKNYLFYPEDEVLLYYMLESIRRKVYLFPKLKNVGFLTEKNYSKDFKDNKGILHNLNYLLLTDEMDKIKDTALINSTPLFETYHEAFRYFASRSFISDCSEINLTIGLYLEDDSLKKHILEKYLTCPNANNKEYVQHYLNNTLLENIKGDKRLFLFENIDYYKSNSKVNRWDNMDAYNLSITTKKVIDKEIVLNSYNTESIYFFDWNALDFSSRVEAKGMLLKLSLVKPNNKVDVESYYSKSKKLNKQNPFEAFPEVWYYFKRNSLCKVLYFYVYGVDNRYGTSFLYETKIRSFIYNKDVNYTKFYNSEIPNQISNSSVIKIINKAINEL